MSILGISLLVLPLVILIAIAALARRKPTGRPLTLVVTRFIAITYAVLTFTFTAISVVTTLVSDAVEATIPVRRYWPEPHPWITIENGPTATVTDGGFSLADVTISGLGADARLLLAAGHLLQGLTFTVIAIVVALLCHRLLGGEPFKAAISRSITVTAVAIAAGGVLWQACFWIGGSIASAQALTISAWASDHPLADDPLVTEVDPFATGLPEPTVAFTLDFWPLMLGLALAAVAAAFRYGERLQRDSDGLI